MDEKTSCCEELRWVRLEINGGDLRNILRMISLIVNGKYFPIIVSIEEETCHLFSKFSWPKMEGTVTSLSPPTWEMVQLLTIAFLCRIKIQNLLCPILLSVRRLRATRVFQ